MIQIRLATKFNKNEQQKGDKKKWWMDESDLEELYRKY
jgi:hypothetical protein